MIPNPITPQLGPQDQDIGNGQGHHTKSDIEMSVAISKELEKFTAKLNDTTISVAVKAIESRKFLDWHTEHVKATWMDWRDESAKVLEDIRQTRVAIEFESKHLLSACADVRKFFISETHDLEVAKLREFIELAERLRALKNDGTLDRLADTILKLA